MKVIFRLASSLLFVTTQASMVLAADAGGDYTGYLEASNPTRRIYAKLHVDSVTGQGCKANYMGSFEWGGIVQEDGSVQYNRSLKKPMQHAVTGATVCENGKQLVKFTPGKWIVYPPAPLPPLSFEGEFDGEKGFSGVDNRGLNMVLHGVKK